MKTTIIVLFGLLSAVTTYANSNALSEKCIELGGISNSKSSCFMKDIKEPRINEQLSYSKDNLEKISEKLMEACSKVASDDRAVMEVTPSGAGRSYFCFISID